MSGAHRFLIDECLPLVLVDVANSYGYEAHHAVRLGLSNVADNVIMRRVIEENFVFTTNNRDDFHDLVNWAGLHPGLLILHGSEPREVRVRQFEAALLVMRSWADAINKVVEVYEDERAEAFTLPPLD